MKRNLAKAVCAIVALAMWIWPVLEWRRGSITRAPIALGIEIWILATVILIASRPWK